MDWDALLTVVQLVKLYVQSAHETAKYPIIIDVQRTLTVRVVTVKEDIQPVVRERANLRDRGGMVRFVIIGVVWMLAVSMENISVGNVLTVTEGLVLVCNALKIVIALTIRADVTDGSAGLGVAREDAKIQSCL